MTSFHAVDLMRDSARLAIMAFVGVAKWEQTKFAFLTFIAPVGEMEPTGNGRAAFVIMD
jgi:hypothetical protein